MSALGQKRTFALQNGMSALPPKADMCSAPVHAAPPRAYIESTTVIFLIFLLPGRIFAVSSWFAGAVRIAIAILYISHRFPIRTVAVIGLILFASIRASGCASKKDKGDE
jgi:hypothetical protein